MTRLRQNFLTGLLAITPLAITGWILWRFYVIVDGAVRPLLDRVPVLKQYVPPFVMTVSGVVVSVLVIALVGMFTKNLIGVAFFNVVERVLTRIPIIRGVFSATKQIAEVFLKDRRTAFQKVVLFEYPRRGVFSIGFVTHEDGERGLLHVFLPTTPNPTSGFMLIMSEEEAQVLPIGVEEGIRMIISGGAVTTGSYVPGMAELARRLKDRESAPGEEDGR